MLTEEIFASVYTYCGEPDEADLPFNLVFRAVRDAQQALLVDLNLSSQLWRLASKPLTLDPSSDTFEFDATNYSRAVFAEVNLPGSLRKPRIRCVDLQDQRLLDRLEYANAVEGMRYGAGFGGVQEVGFFRLDGRVKVRANPAPTEVVEITVYYEPSIAADLSEGVAPDLLEIFHYLLIYKAAKFCVNYVRGMDPDMKSRITGQLGEEIEKAERQWHEFRTQDNQETNDTFEGFDLGNDMGWGF